MAYRFQRTETLARAVRRVYTEEIAWAVGQLTSNKENPAAVHEARKSVKKIRGLLGLIQDRLGSSYKPEDQYFKAAGRQLSDLRDRAVMLEVFAETADRHPRLDAAALDAIRRNLQRSLRETGPGRDVKTTAARLFEEAKSKPAGWQLDAMGFAELLPALKAAYRDGAKALKRAQATDSTEVLHSFRKKVKQHWYHLRLLEGVWDQETKERAKQLRDLETWLGDANNLAVLRERILLEIETTRDRQQVQQFIELLEKDAEELRLRALETGHRLYASKPSVFIETLAVLGTRFPTAQASAA